MARPRALIVLLAALLLAGALFTTFSSLSATTGETVKQPSHHSVPSPASLPPSQDSSSSSDDDDDEPLVNVQTVASPCPTPPPRTTNKKILEVEAFLAKQVNITGTTIPLIIHQIWISKNENEVPSDVQESIDSWKKMNPDALHITWGGADIQSFVELHFSNFADMFAALPLPVMKADLFRYMVLSIYGGVYSDTDTRSLKPVKNWAAGGQKGPVNAIIGVEVDALDVEDWARYWARAFQWCQWSIAAGPRHPILVGTIHKIISKVYLEGTDGWKKDLIGFVMELTGPGLWTDNVNAFLASKGEDWHQFSLMKEHTYVKSAEVLLLTITGFSPGMGRQGSKDPSDPQAQVAHWFKGRWKDHAAGNN
ncbi:nucleotide-diphospho-sugar transferase [Cladochytrium replicatum]|nr:nucleotide-diphospho-sugar transferase [Cladochytrium replicatum]